MKNRVALLLDSQQLFVNSFSLLLLKHKLFDRIKCAEEDFEVDSLLHEFPPQDELYVFVDYYLENHNAIRIVQSIKKKYPFAYFIFNNSMLAPKILDLILKFRPDGIINKFCSLSTLKECLNTVKAGVAYVDDKTLDVLQQSVSNISFTHRELELLKYFSDGFNITETAALVSLSKHTVGVYRRRMLVKTQCGNIGQLIKVAKEHELI